MKKTKRIVTSRHVLRELLEKKYNCWSSSNRNKMKTKGNLEYQEWRKVYGMNKGVGNYNRLSSSQVLKQCYVF